MNSLSRTCEIWWTPLRLRLIFVDMLFVLDGPCLEFCTGFYMVDKVYLFWIFEIGTETREVLLFLGRQRSDQRLYVILKVFLEER